MAAEFLGAFAQPTLARPMHCSSAMNRLRWSTSIFTILAASIMAFSLATLAGCSHVAPYERGTLAHPTMSAEDPFATALDEHVRSVSEGASGGLAGGGGGCGCN